MMLNSILYIQKDSAQLVHISIVLLLVNFTLMNYQHLLYKHAVFKKRLQEALNLCRDEHAKSGTKRQRGNSSWQ